MKKDVQIRLATADDLGAVLHILNYYIQNSHHTFDTVPFTIKQKGDWFDLFTKAGRHQLIVAEAEGEILAYAHSMPFKPKPAYVTTVETTVYVDHRYTSQGLGGLMLEQLFNRLCGTGVHSAIAVITLPGEASIALHRKLGFEHAGSLQEAGFKFGRFWDVAWYQRFFTD